jgi:hypothetical protein
MAGVVLAAHGAVHLMGVVLLWHWGQPGTLRYGDVHPAPGTPGGVLVGAGWLAAAVLFAAAAVLVARRREQAARLAEVSAVVSAAVLVPSAAVAVAVAGLVIDAVVLLVMVARHLVRR